MRTVIAKLRAAASGEYTPPDVRCTGVCMLYMDYCYEAGVEGDVPDICDIFEALGYESAANPLGTYQRDNLWDEVVGPARRELCGKVADWLENWLNQQEHKDGK